MPVDFTDEWWTEARAVLLTHIFEGQKGLRQLCVELGIPYTTAQNWVKHEQFRQALQELRKDTAAQLEGIPFLRREQRLMALSKLAEQARDEWESKRYLTEQRPVPGGVMTNEKLNRDAAEVYRNSLADIAAELGQRHNKVDISAPDSAPAVVIQQIAVTPEMIGQYLQAGLEAPASATTAALPAGQVEADEDNPFADLESEETSGEDF